MLALPATPVESQVPTLTPFLPDWASGTSLGKIQGRCWGIMPKRGSLYKKF